MNRFQEVEKFHMVTGKCSRNFYLSFFSFFFPPPVNEDLLQSDSTDHVVTQLRTHDGK